MLEFGAYTFSFEYTFKKGYKSFKVLQDPFLVAICTTFEGGATKVSKCWVEGICYRDWNQSRDLRLVRAFWSLVAPLHILQR